MFSFVFWCEFIDLVGFFGCYCLTHVNLFIIMNSNQKTQEYIKRKFPLFII